MAKVSSRYSRVNGVVCHGYWELETSVLSRPVWCSDTCGGPVLMDATQDWKAQVQAWGHTPGVNPGETFKFEGMDSNGAGWASDALGAIVTKFELTCQVASPDADTPIFPIWYTMDIAGNGEIATNASLAADALEVPTFYTGLARAAKLDTGAVTGCTQWQLTVINNAVAYSDSDVSGWMQRLTGNYDASLVYRVNMDGISNVPETNTDVAVSLPVTATTSWDIECMRVLDRRAVYDHGSRTGKAKMIGLDVIMGWNSIEDGTRGVITAPDGTDLWPTDECVGGGD